MYIYIISKSYLYLSYILYEISIICWIVPLKSPLEDNIDRTLSMAASEKCVFSFYLFF